MSKACLLKLTSQFRENGWKETQKMAKQIPWIVSMNPADRTFYDNIARRQW